MMILTTTSEIEGGRIDQYLGVVTGEAIIGANLLKDFTASLHDLFGGRSGSYEKVLKKSRNIAMQEMQECAAQLGADAVVGISFDYETLGYSSSMILVTCNGTAVKLA